MAGCRKDRIREARAKGSRSADRRRIEPTHQAEPVREVPFDDTRKEHIAQGDGRSTGRCTGEEGRKVPHSRDVQGPQQQPYCEDCHGPEEHSFRTESAGQDGGKGCEDAQQSHRHRSEDHQRPARQTGVGRYFRQDRGEAREDRPKVQADQDQADTQVDEAAFAS